MTEPRPQGMESETVRQRVEADLRWEFADWIAKHPNARSFDWNVATTNVLAALGLDDLDAFVVRVADDLYGVHSDAYRRGLVARALEAALTATGEGEASDD